MDAAKPLLWQSYAKISWGITQYYHLRRVAEAYGSTVKVGKVRLSPRQVALAVAATDLPLEINMLTGNVLHAFRSALETTVNELYTKATGKVHSRLGFPFHKTEREFMDKLRGEAAIWSVLPNVELLFERVIRPWHGGNTVLWTLNQLDNRQKHRVIPVVLGKVTSTGIALSADGECFFSDNIIMLRAGDVYAPWRDVIDFDITNPGTVDIELTFPPDDDLIPEQNLFSALEEFAKVAFDAVHALHSHMQGSKAAVTIEQLGLRA